MSDTSVIDEMMAKYGLETPEPQNATDRLLQEYFPEEQAARFAGMTATGKDPQDFGVVGRMLTGGINSIAQTGYGIKGMFGDLSEEDQQQRARSQAMADRAGGWGTTGEVVTDMASLGAGAAGVARGIARAGVPFLSRPMVATPLAEAAVGAAASPENRFSNAGFAALGGTAGEGLARALTAAPRGPLYGFTTPEAQELIGKGVPVPAWKAVGGRPRAMGERLRVFPGTGQAMRGMERQSLQEWNRNIIGQATPPKPVWQTAADGSTSLEWDTRTPVREIGWDAMSALRDRFDKAYGEIFDNASVRIDPVSSASARNQFTQLVTEMKTEYPNYADELDGVLATLNKKMPDGKELPMSAVKDVLDNIDTRASTASRQGQGDLLGIYTELRGNLEDFRMDMLPAEMREQVAPINQAYANYKVLRRVMQRPAVHRREYFSPQDLDAAIKANDRTPDKVMYGEGRASPYQRQGKLVSDVFGSELPDAGPGTAEKLLPWVMGPVGLGLPAFALGDMGMTAALTTPTGQRMMMGELPGQETARRVGPTIHNLARMLGMTSAMDREIQNAPRGGGF